MRRAIKNKPKLQKELKESKLEKEALIDRINANKASCVRIVDAVYSGVEINIKDASRIIHDHISHCRFVREGADVKMTDF